MECYACGNAAVKDFFDEEELEPRSVCENCLDE